MSWHSMQAVTMFFSTPRPPCALDSTCAFGDPRLPQKMQHPRSRSYTARFTVMGMSVALALFEAFKKPFFLRCLDVLPRHSGPRALIPHPVDELCHLLAAVGVRALEL